MIDTGFNGFLTSPPALVSELGAVLSKPRWRYPGDDSIIAFDVWEITVLWDGTALAVEADEADTTPLVGMLLLDNHSLFMEVADGGRMVLQAIE